jgi:hypothetical protein
MKLGQRIAQNQIAKLYKSKLFANCNHCCNWHNVNYLRIAAIAAICLGLRAERTRQLHGGIYYGSTAQFISNEL